MTGTQNKKELYKGHIQEGLENMRAAELLKVRMSEIKASVKESGIDVKEFTATLNAAFDLDKTQEKIDSLQRGVDSVEDLGL